MSSLLGTFWLSVYVGFERRVGFIWIIQIGNPMEKTFEL